MPETQRLRSGGRVCRCSARGTGHYGTKGRLRVSRTICSPCLLHRQGHAQVFLRSHCPCHSPDHIETRPQETLPPATHSSAICDVSSLRTERDMTRPRWPLSLLRPGDVFEEFPSPWISSPHVGLSFAGNCSSVEVYSSSACVHMRNSRGSTGN